MLDRCKVLAVIKGLEARDWASEGFNNVVVGASIELVDSLYDLHRRCGALMDCLGNSIPNSDVWENLLNLVSYLGTEKGVLVQFWPLTRPLNPASVRANNQLSRVSLRQQIGKTKTLFDSLSQYSPRSPNCADRFRNYKSQG